MRHKINKIKNEKHMQLTTKQLTKTGKEIQKLDFGIFFFLNDFLNSPPKLELNIVLNVKQKQEWIMSTPPEVDQVSGSCSNEYVSLRRQRCKEGLDLSSK